MYKPAKKRDEEEEEEESQDEERGKQYGGKKPSPYRRCIGGRLHLQLRHERHLYRVQLFWHSTCLHSKASKVTVELFAHWPETECAVSGQSGQLVLLRGPREGGREGGRK